MLILSRRTNQVVNIHTRDGIIRVHLIECNQHQSRLGFVAPDSVTIVREEIDTFEEDANHSGVLLNSTPPQRKTILSLLRELFKRESTGRH